MPLDGDSRRCVSAEVIPGEAGSDRIWYYSMSSEGDVDDSSVMASATGLTILSRGWQSHYIIQGDSLAETGREKRLSETLYLEPVVRLAFPFNRGRSVSSQLRGVTRYGDRLYIGFRGEATSEADADGIITDGADTLRNVMRICHRRDFVQKASLSASEAEAFARYDSVFSPDSLHILEFDYEWYCPGSRYPVMSCHESYVIAEGDTIPRSHDARLCLPADQAYDLGENIASGTESRQPMSSGAANRGDGDGSDLQGGDGSGLGGVSASLVSGSGAVEVGYSLQGDCDVVLAVHDAIGRQLARSVRLGSSAGNYSEHLTLSFRPIGVVMLIVTVNDIPHLYKIGN